MERSPVFAPAKAPIHFIEISIRFAAAVPFPYGKVRIGSPTLMVLGAISAHCLAWSGGRNAQKAGQIPGLPAGPRHKSNADSALLQELKSRNQRGERDTIPSSGSQLNRIG